MTTTDVESLADSDFEQILHCTDESTGLDSVIVIHDTTLGPALGGIRMRAYPDHASATADAKQLAEAMSYKAALAGLKLGGGKSVINTAPDMADREALLLAHARRIQSLGGRYIPGIDMGTTVQDLNLVGTVVSTVSSSRLDPSGFTARGVVAAIRAAVDLTEGRDLGGMRVGIQGLGNVGARMAAMLAAEGARLVVADVDETRCRSLAAELGATVVQPSGILSADIDVLAPCAAGAVVTTEVAQALTARYVIGAANNVLAEPGVAATLRARGVVYVPDFIANAGGLIACAAEVHNDESTLLAGVEHIGRTTEEVLQAAEKHDLDTATVAVTLAKERIAAGRQSSAG